ncbi:hypothetical protein Pelo_19801 [Pelomyxa schiedti]|nr:hypothetical protein Pelo_19801 [Pelomyxa schiedti]
MVSLMLAVHPRCGAHTALALLLLLRGYSPVDAGGTFLRALWSDYIAATQARFVVDLVPIDNTPHDCGVQLCVSPAALALTRPVTTHCLCPIARLDVDCHLGVKWGGCVYELRVVDTAVSGTKKGREYYYVVHNNSNGSYCGNSRWVVMFSCTGGEEGTVIITKVVDLAGMNH